MVPEKIKFGLWTNNTEIHDYFTDDKNTLEILFQTKKKEQKYFLVLIDLEEDVSQSTQTLIDTYQSCREKNTKLVVVLLHGKKINNSQNSYYADLLSDLGQSNPLHRLLSIPFLILNKNTQGVTWLDKYLEKAVKNQKIEVSKLGNQVFYPISYADLEKAILKSTFVSNTGGKQLWIGGEPVSDLDIAYYMQSKLRAINLDFDIEATSEGISHPEMRSMFLETQAVLNWKPSVDIEDQIKNLVKNILQDKKLNKIYPDNIKKGNRYHGMVQKIRLHREKIGEYNPKNLLKKTLVKALEITAVFYFTFSIVFLYTIFTSLKSTELSLYYLRKGDISKSASYTTKTRNLLRISQFNFQFISPLFNYLSPDQNQKNENLISFINYTSGTVESLSQTFVLAEKIYLSVGNEAQNTNYEELTMALKSNLQLGYENISQIEMVLSRGKLPQFLENEIKKNIEYEEIKNIRDQITQLIKFADTIPASLSGDIAKNILIVFQDSKEMRSTGGIIDSLNHLVIENGKLITSKIYASQDLENIGLNDMDPPPLVKDLTGATFWKIRDLSYNPDYPQTAANLYWVIEKKLNFKPDVIIFTTEKTIEDLLGENSPKHNDRKGKIQLLNDQVFNHQIPFLSVVKIVSKLISESNFLYWSADSETEKGILNQNYAGSVRSRECHPGLQSARECISQTAHLSISNFSAVPLGTSLKHKTKHLVSIEPDKVSHIYEVEYEYQDKIENLNRDLVEVYQLYIPQRSTLKEVTVDGRPIELSKLFAQSEVGLDRYQFPISTSFNTNHKVTINFAYYPVEKIKLPIAYSFTEIRQPGTNNDGVTLEISFPASIKAQAITSQVQSDTGKIIYQYPKKTSTFGVHFVPNQI